MLTRGLEPTSVRSRPAENDMAPKCCTQENPGQIEKPPLSACNFVTNDPLVTILVPFFSPVSHLQNGTKNVANGYVWKKLGANKVGTYFNQCFPGYCTFEMCRFMSFSATLEISIVNNLGWNPLHIVSKTIFLCEI